MTRRGWIFVFVAVGLGAAVAFWPTPRRAAIARVESLGGTYSDEHVPEGDGYRHVVCINLTLREPTDDDLAVLRDIRPLHRVILDGTPVTNAGLTHLTEIDGLDYVSLCNTAVTDDDLAHLRRIPGLRSLHLVKTQVSDAGLAHLHGHPQLEFVNVASTRVTDQGAEDLQHAAPGIKFVYLHVPQD